MIEFSFAELFLLVWAIVATLVAIFSAQREQAAKHFINAMLEDDGLRNELVSSYKMFKAGNQ